MLAMIFQLNSKIGSVVENASFTTIHAYLLCDDFLFVVCYCRMGDVDTRSFGVKSIKLYIGLRTHDDRQQ